MQYTLIPPRPLLLLYSISFPCCFKNSPSLPPQPSTPNEILALPSVLIDFMAMTVCDLIPSRKCKSQQNTFGQDRHPMPELVHFIQKITFSAGVNCRTALVALIYLDRAKAALPKGAAGGHDTPHRMFLASMAIASNNPSYCLGPLTNAQLSNLCSGLFSLDKSYYRTRLSKLIDYRCWVDDLEVKELVLQARVDFPL
ncbi:cyclin domain-containing protein [Phycomyces blakesleeanus]